MASPTSPTRAVRVNQGLIYGREAVAAGTVAAAFTREPCRSMSPIQINRTTETQTEYTQLAASHVGEDKMFESGQLDCVFPVRVAGMGGGLGLMTMLGNAADTVSGAGPYVHTGVPNALTTSCNTWSLLADYGDRNASNVPQNLEQMLFGTLNTYGLTVQPNGVATAALSFVGVAPTWVAQPSIATYVGSTANYPVTRINPVQTVFNVYNSASALFTAKITQLTLNLSRGVSPEFALGSKDPFDIVPDELMISGGFTATFDGNAANSIRREYANYTELGDSTHIHNITMTIDGNNSIVFNFYPIRITGAAPDNSGRVKISCTFNSYNDLAVLNAASPVITSVKSIVVTNGLSAVMVA